MSSHVEIARNGKTITVRIPHTFRSATPRKAVIVPQGIPAWAPAQPKPNNAILKALGQSWRWKKMIDSGEHATLAELAKAESVNFSYLCRVIRLGLLAPTLIKQILDGRQPIHLQKLLKPLPDQWSDQERQLRG